MRDVTQGAAKGGVSRNRARGALARAKNAVRNGKLWSPSYWSLRFGRATGRLPSPERPPAPGALCDWLFITPKESQGWILDAICREIGGRYRGAWKVAYNPKKLPDARAYFFSHYSNYLDALERAPFLASRRAIVWYTHPRDVRQSNEEVARGLNTAHRIISACSQFKDLLIDNGVDASKMRVVLGAADPVLFKKHARTQTGVVGFSSAYYERKNPDLILELVESMPHRRFLLIGRNWQEYPRFDRLCAASNFQYVTANHSEYPALYRKMSVFVSASRLEGGPIPLIEAMMCNVVPAASRTGFAPDIIQDGENGYLFDVDASAEIIRPMIDRAFALETDVRKTVRRLTWRRFAREIISIAGEN